MASNREAARATEQASIAPSAPGGTPTPEHTTLLTSEGPATLQPCARLVLYTGESDYNIVRVVRAFIDAERRR